MKSFFQHSLLRQAIIAATLGTASTAYADTIVDKDTLIDGSSPANESYRIENGATLTANGSVTGNITVSDGHLAMKSGHINGYVWVERGSSATFNNATMKSAFLQGDSQLTNTDIDGQLVIAEAMLSAKNISAEQYAAFDAESVIERGYFDSTLKGETRWTGAVDFYNTNGSFIDSVIKGHQSGIYLHSIGDQRYKLGLIRSSVWAIDGPAFKVENGKHAILLQNGSTAGSESGELLTAVKGSDVALTLNASHAAGDIRAEDGAVVDVALANGSVLSGGMTNVNSLSLDNSSLYEMTASSDIKTLSMAGGTVKFASAEGGEYRTLTLGTLSGNGNFMMNADLLSGEGDLLDISGTASGKYTLHLAATGREAANREALALVRTGGGDAEFALNGGRLDVGAWQQQLVRNGNNWELVHAGSTSSSTDAMLAMASAPQFMHEGELNVLQSRLDDMHLEPQSGMWATALHSRSDVDGAWDSAYRLEQNGLMLGGDKVTELDAGKLSTGAYLSQSTGQVKHARGGQSRVTGYGGGLYASLTSDNGWYTRGSAQITHFSNKMSARMSDGGTARADWNSWGYGLGMEAGRHIAVSDTTQLTPFAGLNGWLTPSESVSLNNGMTAETGDGRSLQAEAGLRFSTRLDVGAVKVAPYATAALSQALVKNGSTRINETVDFTNNFTGTGGKLSGGVSVMLTSSTRVWMEAGYAKSEHAESPLVGNVGLRVDF
ncbi:autotransporter outer membrane beta-barrel domain-containing protein [Enterobacter mori]|uniref:autotransporter outer membrane beta-barrel domain-containing protein n=1 Tax=Enterobacter mori TaxID=539813 RepID=UPI0021B0C4F6|nr:autotransporter outer membrane beta-barrel domain-containing protein [Enterobacter mori]MCT6663589.1 autotransporter outer membrane beta-barrel domain-containing protein [Enterobacter mori]